MRKILFFLFMPLILLAQLPYYPTTGHFSELVNHYVSLKEDISLLTISSVDNQQTQSDSSQMTIITLVDGSELNGIILEEDEEKIKFRTRAGVEIEINRNQTERIETVAGVMVEGELRRPDPNRTRLLFAPTGRSLPAGSGYFSVYELFFPISKGKFHE